MVTTTVCFSEVLFYFMMLPLADVMLFYCLDKKQSAKTKVINNCLNPVWDEELSFTLKDPAAVLSLVCFIIFLL